MKDPLIRLSKKTSKDLLGNLLVIPVSFGALEAQDVIDCVFLLSIIIHYSFQFGQETACCGLLGLGLGWLLLGCVGGGVLLIDWSVWSHIAEFRVLSFALAISYSILLIGVVDVDAVLLNDSHWLDIIIWNQVIFTLIRTVLIEWVVLIDYIWKLAMEVCIVL